MTQQALRNLEWVNLTDWDNLQEASLSFFDHKVVTQETFDAFLTALLKSLSEEFNISYDLFLSVFYEKNVHFYFMKSHLFDDSKGVEKNSVAFARVQDTLKIPKFPELVSFLGKSDAFSAVTSIFDSLNFPQQEILLSYLNELYPNASAPKK